MRKLKRTVLATCVLGVVGAVALSNSWAAQNRQTARGPEAYLSNADVQAIRRAELRDDDTGVGFRFTNNLIRRFVESKQGMELRDFSRGTDLQKALYIIRNTDDPDLLNDLVIRNDPASMRVWRQNVQPIVLQGCASAGCHGGTEPVGGLQLYRNAQNENVAYTNFYNLATFEQEVEGEGMFGGGMKKMIDRQRPIDSLLLQYSLPANVADTPHPKPPGGQDIAMFRSTNDQRFRAIGLWIEQGLVPMDNKGYDVEFAMPGQGSTTTPSTQPAE
ncbi:MAG: hypothetical protein AAGD32_06880 [Planctomycetota bacterium]